MQEAYLQGGAWADTSYRDGGRCCCPSKIFIKTTALEHVYKSIARKLVGRIAKIRGSSNVFQLLLLSYRSIIMNYAPEFDVSEIESLFSATVPKPADSGGKAGGRRKSTGSKTDKVHLIDLRRENNTEIMLTKVKMPLPDMMAAVLAMDESVLDVDQVENLIKFCPTKEEMELLKGYTGDKESLGKCEQYFMELMKVPRVESKLQVFSFKIQFNCQISEFKKSLNTVNSACEETTLMLAMLI
ncbi:formin-like protein 20 isoform X2 [Humulus lupulus]|uniref:formin-like protein 20 isoform X2 n=1 Tax=Humulus lupulus TaxID=3486 RepID=UPI002B4033E8|nr:formin-like protein 20 isoform X2 [Humulus lupulus]